MKSQGVLNAELSRIIAAMGHTDLLVIGDVGLPVPPGVAFIDLAVTLGVPRFEEVLQAVLTELCVERAAIASEAGEEVRRWTAPLSPSEVPHDDFKALTTQARAVVRTGEATPYANVALWSGVVF